MTCRAYDDWLRTQSPRFQQEVLSDDTLINFQSGVQVDGFKDENYRPIELADLQQLDELDLTDS